MADETKKVQIVYEGLDEAPLVFANALLAQHTEHEFILTFAQLQPPIVITEEQLKAAQELEQVPAKVAVRIALPPGRLVELIHILQGNYEKYVRRIEKISEGSEESDGELSH